MPSSKDQTTRRTSLKDLVIATSSLSLKHTTKSTHSSSSKQKETVGVSTVDHREKLKVRGCVFRVPNYQQVGSNIPKGELEAVSPGVSKLPKSVQDKRRVMAAFERRYGVGWDL